MAWQPEWSFARGEHVVGAVVGQRLLHSSAIGSADRFATGQSQLLSYRSYCHYLPIQFNHWAAIVFSICSMVARSADLTGGH